MSLFGSTKKQKTVNTTNITDASSTAIETDNAKLDVGSGVGVKLSDSGSVNLNLSDQGAVKGALSLADASLGTAYDSLDRATGSVERVSSDAFTFAQRAQSDAFGAFQDIVQLAGDITKGVTASAFDVAENATTQATTSADERLTKTVVVMVGILGAVVVLGAMLK